MDGILNIYKEKGYTSHDVVAVLRGILRQRKIGHTGTLDPDAEGVLPVCIGTATKACQYLADSGKEYIACLRLGIETDTQDITGQIICEKEVNISKSEISDIIGSFKGRQSQIPPMYSALKVNGKKLYEYARQGVEIERKPRTVEFYEIEILSMDLPDIKIRVSCSKGTYIRTLCHDIGRKARCGACMVSLIRTRSSSFLAEDSKRLDEVEKVAKDGRIDDLLIPIDEAFSSFPALAARKECSKALYNGNSIGRDNLAGADGNPQRVRIYDSKNTFIGLYNFDNNKNTYKPEKIFYRKMENENN